MLRLSTARLLIMKKIIVILLLFIASVQLAGAAIQPPENLAYVEPQLNTAAGDSLSLIVTASESQQAARAVELLGGQVSSDLWLIDGVAATLPATQLDALASSPGIISIVNNKSVEPADDPADWDGWMSDRRQKSGTYTFESTLRAPATFLPGGGFVAVTEHGEVLIVDADGNEQARRLIPDDHFFSSPVVSPDGTIYLVRPDEKELYALNPDGTLRWAFANGEELRGGLVVGPDGTAYTTDKKRNVIALNPATGQELWRRTIDFDHAGDVSKPLAIGPDGTLYQIVKGDPDRLYAITPANTIAWKFVADKDSLAPIVGANGLIYLPNKNKKVFILNAANGSRLSTLQTDSDIESQPLLGPDGSLYVTSKDNTLYGLNPDGSVRYVFVANPFDFNSGPLLSPDGATAYYIGHDASLLHAMDPANGTERWRFAMPENIEISPRLDADANIILGSKYQDLVVVNPAGRATTRLRLDNQVVDDFVAGPNGEIVVATDDRVLGLFDRLPDYFDPNNPDAEPTEVKREWRLSNRWPSTWAPICCTTPAPRRPAH
jgi:outer membrane protein assembly factor BamB